VRPDRTQVGASDRLDLHGWFDGARLLTGGCSAETLLCRQAADSGLVG